MVEVICISKLHRTVKKAVGNSVIRNPYYKIKSVCHVINNNGDRIWMFTARVKEDVYIWSCPLTNSSNPLAAAFSMTSTNLTYYIFTYQFTCYSFNIEKCKI